MSQRQPSIDEQVERLFYGAEFGDPGLEQAMRRELRQRLEEARAEGRPLRVYCGYDPTAPDLHLGHSITLRKLRLFQDFGHHVIFLVGTFTALVGDTSDKLTGRPPQDPAKVREAACSYAEQCFLILDRERTEVVYNGDWLNQVHFPTVVELAAQFTVQQFLARDNFRRRIEAGDPVGLHEFLYPLCQGYDAVHLRADVQLGATEQLFNIMAGRKLQQAYGQKPCIVLTFPVLVGTDGKERMSKSKGNYVGLREPPEEQYGKVMSIPDEAMVQWLRLVTRFTPEEVERRLRDLAEGRLHPMALKKELAFEIVAMYHGPEAAEAAARHFERVHQDRRLPEQVPELAVEGPLGVVEALERGGLVRSRSEARRLIQGGGVKVDGRPVASHEEEVAPGALLQVGKRRFLRLVPARQAAEG
ncbi:MAG: tyrosine--tRNA ligase [Gammaproteobacteria bacterium]|nr:MAG: tyrosine--tRNA ligase [Gammaproteobacteria bacterium]